MEPRSRFEALPTRPPTPPKESGISSDGPDPHQLFGVAKLPKPPLDTPDESPSSVAELPSKSSDRPSKRVDFQLGSSKLATVETSSPHDSGSIRSQPSSRHSRPVKSILKQSTVVPSDNLGESQGPRDFPRMLDDFARQLAVPSASSRLDAYIQLNNCLKTYKNMPEQQALREKMPLLTTFIERDLQETEVGEGARSTQLATEVVRLVTTLLWSPTMADVLPESFQSFILDKSIAVAGSEGIPKALVNQYLHLLAVQNFRPKIMTTDRANRIITNLGRVTEHIKGKQVVAHKLEIYKKLISQSRNVASHRFRDWYECLFHGLLAPNQEIRVRALSLALEAGLELGASEHVTKAVINLFNHKVESNELHMRYGNLFVTRLQERLGVKEERQQVPQLWAAVLLFLRHRSRPLERWSFTSEWLRVMQQCLNIGDMDLRLQAIRAWTRWIYVVDPSISTSENMASLLRTPIEKQLDRFRLPEKETKRLRASVVATYSTLLYYAFRPNSSPDVLDRYWSLYVAHFFVPGSQGTLPLDVATGSAILFSLIGDDRQKVWSASRAIESPPIKPDELPRIEPKWVRTRASTVLTTLENILLSEEWWSGEVEQTSALRIWRAFTKALGEASRKEVKVSPETMQAVAEVVGTLVRFFIQSTIRTLPSDTIYLRLAALIQAAVQNIGHLPFAEQRLLRAAPEKYSVIAAPAGRSHKASSPQITAFAGLLDAVVSSCTKDSLSEQAQDLLALIIQNALKAGTSFSSRLSILRGFCSRLKSSSEETATNPAKTHVWNVCADYLRQDLDQDESPNTRDNSMIQMHDLRNLTRILEIGRDLSCTPNWSKLLKSIRSFVTLEAGFAVWMICIAKPLVELFIPCLQKELNEPLLSDTILLLDSVDAGKYHSDSTTPRKDISKALGLSPKQGGAAYEPLLTLANQTLYSLYPVSKKLDLQAQANLFAAASNLFRAACNGLSSVPFLGSLEAGLAIWFEDRSFVLNVETVEATTLFRSCVELWQIIAASISGPYDQSMLNFWDHTFAAALGSRHRAVANHAILVWNTTFGREPHLQYSHALFHILLRLSDIADVSAPCLIREPGQPIKDPLPMLSYLPTPANLEELDPEFEADTVDFGPSPRPNRRPLSAIAANDSPMMTPVRASKDRKPHSTPRLRHDDSQIQFAAITSSPPNIEALESQLLTEHQRDVRDRQQAEAQAMFPDLRSSPRRKLQERDLPRLRLRAEADLPRSNIDDQHSPTLPPPSETPFLGSSPTPSQRLSSRDRGSASSRASVDSHLAALDDREHRSRPATPAAKSEISSELQTFGEELLALYEEPIEELVVLPPSSEQLSSESDCHFADAECHFDPAEVAPEKEQTLPHTTVPQTNESSSECQVIKPLPDHSAKEDAPREHVRKDDEDGEIAAQILNDIERATSMSQDTSSAAEGQLSSSQTTRSKRRHGVARLTSSVKRRSATGRPAAIRPPKALCDSDDDMEECIIVAASQPSRPRCQTPTSKVEVHIPMRRPLKSSPAEESSACPSSEPVWDVPPTPEVQRKTAARKRRSPEPSVTAEPKLKKSRVLKSPDLETIEVASSSQQDQHSVIAVQTKVEKFSINDPVIHPNTKASAANRPPPPSESAIGADSLSNAPTSQECGVPSPAPSTPQRTAITSIEFLARVRQLAEEAKLMVLDGHGDEIMAGLMDVGREVMEAKRRL